ncbi:MAG: patatin-like phospholipase family protein [Rudaea sp.]|nr:patatin-like phospholipase family protein [Rudaea sp.]
MTSPTISLVLGSGGARGYAHIGAIEELLAQGYDIRCISGSSMGALIGGVYAAGKLDAYRDWVKALQRFDVLRLLDWTFTGGGLIKGDRIVDKLKDLIGEVNIEDLPLSYTAVAVDLMSQREVWFSRGSLFEAIRASIAIPTVFRPHHYQGRTLVDGGLLNPVPITPTLRDLTDCTIAVDVNAPAESLDDASPTSPDASAVDATFGSATATLPPAGATPVMEPATSEASDSTALASEADTAQARTYRQRIAEFLDGLLEKRERKPPAETDPGILELFARSLDVVQETITRFKLAAQPPDLVIPIPRNACAFYEFHRAEELIELGRLRTREALRHFRPGIRR